MCLNFRLMWLNTGSCLVVSLFISAMSSIVCSVNNWKKRREFLQQECFEHRPLLRAECTCGAPYNLHPPPNEGEALRLWLKALNLKKTPKRPFVCSFHFVDRKPTKEHPYLEKWLGYDDASLKKPRQVLVRQSGVSNL